MRNPVSFHWFFWEGFGLRGIFVSGRLVSECFHELVSEYFDVGALTLERTGCFLGRPNGL